MGSNKEVIQGGAIIAGVLSFFEATVVFLKAIGVIKDDGIVQAILVYGRIVLPILVTFFTMWWVASRTTSLEIPKDENGTPLVREDTHGPTIAQNKKRVRDLGRSIQR